MKIELQANKRPVKAKARRYPAKQRAFLNKYVDQLVSMGFLIPNANATWQAAPLLVPKPNSKAQFRLAINLQPVNAATVKEAWPMPHLDSEIHDFAGSTCFATMDFVSGYWQLPIHPDSYEACGIVCPNGTYSSPRTLPGLSNATGYFQSTVEPLFQELRPNIKAWLDDFNLHARSEKHLLYTTERFITTCKTYNLFLSARKCRFFLKRKSSGAGALSAQTVFEWILRIWRPFEIWTPHKQRRSYANSYTVVDGWRSLFPILIGASSPSMRF